MHIFRRAKGSRRNEDTSPLSDAQARHTPQDIPSPDTPGIPLPTSPHDIPDNILAFRTITTLLSFIQQEQAFRVEQEMPMHEDIKLDLSTAFATIAVIDHEIVAVATKLTFDKIDVVCATQTPIEGPSTKVAPVKVTSITDTLMLLDIRDKLVRGLEFFVAKNTRKDEPPQTEAPTISNVDVAGDLPGVPLNDSEAVKTWVEQRW